MSYEFGETLTILQNALFSFPVFPVLWTAHCILQSLSLRVTLGGNQGSAGALRFASQNPLSCFLLVILYTFPGGIIGCLLSSEPPLAVLTNTNQVFVMVLSWYLVFYSPKDMFEKFVTGFYLRLPLTILQDFQRLHLVIIGISKIHKVYPHALFYPVVFATCFSSGFMFLKYFESILVNGLSQAFVIPHHSSKTCILASITMTAHLLGYTSITLKNQLAFYTLLMTTFRLLNLHDPYVTLESFGSKVFFENFHVKTDSSSPKTKPKGD